MVDSENPYVATKDGTGASQNRGSASSNSLVLGIVGGILGAIVGSAGYVLLVILLHNHFVPPFRDPPNFGQFGFAIVANGVFGLIVGISYAALPYLRYVFWLALFALVVWLTGTTEPDFDPTNIIEFARYILCALLAALALIAKLFSRRGSAQVAYGTETNDDKESGLKSS